jgi:antitoxin VapB
MAPAFEDRETERLAAEVAQLTGESVDAAVKNALRERRDRIDPRRAGRRRPRTKEELLRFMEAEVWPLIPAGHRGGPPMTKAERARLLGYGPSGD